MKATSPCRRSARCTTATARARKRWSPTASACPARLTTARYVSRNLSSASVSSSASARRPAPYELEHAGQVVEQIIRPTGLLDPEIDVRPATGQVDDLLRRDRQDHGRRLSRAGHDADQKDGREPDRPIWAKWTSRCAICIPTCRRWSGMEIIRDLRLGEFDVLVGINLLREGLDLPEVALVAILDADKEGFLRSEDQPDSDHRPRRAKRRRPRHHVRRRDHRMHEQGH